MIDFDVSWPPNLTNLNRPEMNIHEYQAKALFEKFGVPVPKGAAAKTARGLHQRPGRTARGPDHGEVADPRRRARQGRVHRRVQGRRQVLQDQGRGQGGRDKDARQHARHRPDRPRRPQGPDRLFHRRQRHQEGVLPGDPARPRRVAAGHRRLDRGRRGDREGRARDAGEDLQGRRRPGLRPRRLPGPRARDQARLRARRGEERLQAHTLPLRHVLGDGRRDGRGEPARHDARPARSWRSTPRCPSTTTPSSATRRSSPCAT